jgi:hypothetical protein
MLSIVAFGTNRTERTVGSIQKNRETIDFTGFPLKK